MFSKLKLYIVLGVIVTGIGIFVSQYLDNHSFVSDKFIKQKSDSISTLKKETALQDSLLWSLQQDIDIAKQNEVEFQITIAEQKKRTSEALTAEKISREAIEHYENNGLMRYFVFDRQGIFKKGCFQEVFEKPDNVCK
jgi:phosphoribosyl-AMP cyclohydrolase